MGRWNVDFRCIVSIKPVLNHLTPKEKNEAINLDELEEKALKPKGGASFHEKSTKNSKVKIEKKSYEKQLKERYKKPIRRGDKIQNKKKKR